MALLGALALFVACPQENLSSSPDGNSLDAGFVQVTDSGDPGIDANDSGQDEDAGSSIDAGIPAEDRIVVNGAGFELSLSGARFYPVGFNYIHDNDDQILEHFWLGAFERIEEGLDEMAALGANVVRLHPQLGLFMTGPASFHEGHFQRLEETVAAAYQRGIYTDITGLGLFLADEVPAWLDALSEQERWELQARFWGEVARRFAGDPAIFCYDLINEPVVPGQAETEWMLGELAGFRFVQRIVLDPGGRDTDEIGRQWTQQMIDAIRTHDAQALITVGVMPFVGGTGMHPANLVDLLDFVSPHLYPEGGDVSTKADLIDTFSLGKPVLVEETGVYTCSKDEFELFIRETAHKASGYLAHYFGKSIADYGDPQELAPLFQKQALEVLLELGPLLAEPPSGPIPLHHYTNPTQDDHYYTVVRDDLTYGIFGYVYDDVVAGVLPFNPDGAATALCEIWDEAEHDHRLVSDCVENSSFANLHFAGFGYGAAGADTVPLHEYFDPAALSSYYTTERDDVGLEALGFAYQRVLAHVFTAP